MASFIQTDDVNIVIDPAVALAPNRFGLPPHALEERRRDELWGHIKEMVTEADVLIVSHYHYDHVDPKEPEIYRGKSVLIKHPRRMINPSQKNRAASFIRSIKSITEEIGYADNRTYEFGDTEIRFSKPVPHGSTATRGYVVETAVEADDTFVHSSDVQGPLLEEQIDFIVSERPETLFVDGPSTYRKDQIAQLELRKANENLVKLIREANIRRLVVDHHLTRDLEYRQQIQPVIDAGDELGVAVMVAAEYLDVAPSLLEARRKELHGREG